MELNAFLAPAPGKGEIARVRLLEAAVRVFGEKGLKGATVREIAQEARQNIGAITYYFKNKQGLYLAVIEGIVRELKFQMRDLLEEVERERQAGAVDAEKARALLNRFLTALYLRLLSRSEVMWLGRIIIREQTQPTPAFEILYEQAFRIVHETLSFLVGAATQHDPRDRVTIIRTHSLMGQVWFFAIARETILRRLGWKDLGGRHAETVAAVLGENIEVLLRGIFPPASAKVQ
jgi:AcrR family transcriptional regulator